MSNSVAHAVPVYDILQMLKNEIFRDLRVCVPGKISAVNAAEGTVDVNVMLMQKTTQQGLPNGLDVAYPTLLSCPVFTLQGGGAGAVFPVAVNDECLIIFGDRTLDGWYENGAAVPLASRRMHDIADGFVLVGLNSLQNKLLLSASASEAGVCETKNATGAAVVLNPTTHLVSIRNGTQNLATTMAALVTAINSLNTALGTLNTAIANEGSVLTTAGPIATTNEAAITAVTSALTTVQTQLKGLLY